MKTRTSLLLALLPIAAVAASPVSSVTVQQRYPWNGLVDISFQLDQSAVLTVSAVDASTGSALPVTTLTAEGRDFRNGETSLDAGQRRIVWNADADVPNAVYENVEITVSADEKLYMVVDLEAASGTNPISYRSGPPSGGWPVEYKTKKLVLRRIKSGSFMMGSPSTEWGRNSNEVRHKVTLSKNYYLSIFEITYAQLFLVLGEGIGSSGSDYSYLRGPDYPAKVAETSVKAYTKATSFTTTLSSNTGTTFLLPTEAQWEYACRAGTTSSLYTGKSPESNAGIRVELAGREGIAVGNSSGDSDYPQLGGDHTPTTIPVGSLLPNPWGLYDMLGNASEVCRDTYTASLSSSAVVDPLITSGSDRVVKGACLHSEEKYARAAWRSNGYADSYSGERIGFRVMTIAP